MSNVQLLSTRSQWLDAFPIMHQLRTDLTPETYIALLQDMQTEGYQLYALYHEEEMVALAGCGWRTNFYNKRHVFIYDLVTDENYRSMGYGEELFDYIHHLAKEEGAQYVALESGIIRHDAHRFYEEKFAYDKWCYSFRKNI